MPLTTVAQPGTLIDDREGVLFSMNDGGRIVSVLVSRHALEDIDPPEHGDERIERFNEYRRQFEEIASDKYDKGLLEQDGTVCIRGRDLPGSGH
jgi:predicted PolB exonuclease-like 3'-5' exonuclease